MRLSSVSEDLSGRLRSMSSSSQLLLKTEDMNTFVLNTLFSTLLTASGNQASVADLKLWYSAYLAMVSLKWIFCGICDMHLRTPPIKN